MRRLAIFSAMAMLAACAELPDVPGAASPEAAAADYPALAPLTPLARETVENAVQEDETADQLEARANGLRARAAQLRKPVLTDAERARLAAAE
ncbi:hypothetical protein [uncultured Roseobacter sp.]|uniref:hypothetical protein n=1 Tax=uncultured Roseobacter sp. TaxID=114847 RepID=UPI002619D52F|nr:hypothetical protein [uncultured Roseobacter sp.]